MILEILYHLKSISLCLLQASGNWRIADAVQKLHTHYKSLTSEQMDGREPPICVRHVYTGEYGPERVLYNYFVTGLTLHP